MFRKLIYLVSFVLVLALAGTNVVFGDTVWEGRIEDDLDDVEEFIPGGGIDASSSDLELPYEGTGQGTPQIIGIRFSKVAVPKGASVSNAYIEFTCDETKGGLEPVSLLIEGDLSPNAAKFISSAYEVSGRSKTTAKVVWVPVNWTAIGQIDQTSNIASVIEEIVSQPGWASGNALVVIISDDPANPSIGLRCAEAGPGNDSALLHIEWSGIYAKQPNPPDGQTEVPRDVVLSWKPSISAAPINGHKVYLSENFNDVKDGIGGITQSATSYAPAQPLDFGATYYWRIDEVNGPPDYTVNEGSVWSFTTELFSYPIENITATASSTVQEGMGPENTINGSGLDDNDLHSTEVTDMWLSSNEPLGAWIEYEFDKVYKLHEMWVWNSNQMIELLVGLGLKDVSIDYSFNGTDYTTLGTTHEFSQAPGAAGYAHDTVDFGGLGAKYVRLTANSNWGGILNQYGLSEVRFFFIPVSATEPYPDSGATGVDRAVVLGWCAGREAAKHDVYVSADEQAVIDGTAPVATVAETSYGPLALDLDTTHYWKVNEVNEAETLTTWESPIWSFTTKDHIVVDDFESYNDLDPGDPESKRIFLVWIDGFGVATNGSLVGYENAPFCEQTIVHGGKQSMPLFYNNTGGATSSEAELTLTPAQNWTEAQVQTLAVHFHGTEGNTGQMYVKVNGTKVPYDGQASNLALAGWQVWSIDLASLGASLQNVTKLVIGIDGNGAAGTLYVDDIGLYVSAPAAVTEVRIAASSDEAEEHVLDGSMESMTSSDLELGYEDSFAPENLHTVGCRWVGVTVPKGATITEAWVQFSADDVDNSRHIPDVSLIIEGELSPNPATFSSTAGDISSRPTTTAQVVWDIPRWMTVHAKGPEERTPDISSIIQEIVNQDGWAGNAIVLMFRDNPAKPSQGTREAESLDGSASEAPLLHISYQ